MNLTSRAILLLLFATAPLAAQTVSLPESTIPGLRYYCPPEKVVPRVGPACLHDGNETNSKCITKHMFPLPKPAPYKVQVSWPPNLNRAPNAPNTIQFGRELKTATVNPKTSGKDGLNSLDDYLFGKTAIVEISNEGANGFVIADAVQLLPGKKSSHSGSRRHFRERAKDLTLGEFGCQEKPNILLLFADDLGYETLGCYGGKDFETPNLDRLATQGMRFSRTYTSPVCTPSRMSLYTGTYVSRHGYYNVLPVHLGTKKAVDFRDCWTPFPQLLRATGYQTSVTGKWQLAALESHPQHCREAGFDSWCVWQIWQNGAKTTRYWNPCFNHDGHVRDDIADRFGPDVLADYVIDQMKSAVKAKRPFYVHHNMLLPHWPIVETPADKASGKAASLGGMIAYMDKLCGRILAEVDRLGIADNTVVIFMGDNGTDQKTLRQTEAGEVNGGKADLNDAGTHIPLIVRHPGNIDPGTVTHDLIDMADWFPTICELAGVEIPAEITLDGVSFAGLLHGGEPSRRPWVTGGVGGNLSLFDGQWRVNGRSNRIIDARHLPRESIIETVPEEFTATIKRLRAAAASISTLPRGR